MLALAPLVALFACAPVADAPLEEDRDGDGVFAPDDCDDRDPRRAPDEPETCDRLDNDCDGAVDADDPDLTDGATWFVDADGDGAGDGRAPVARCGRADGYASSAGDCDDHDPDVTFAVPWYLDADGDGFGDPADALVACDAPSDRVAADTDCDDADPDVFPGAPEVCGDGRAQDCAGAAPDCGPSGDVPLSADGAALVGPSGFGAALASLGAPDGVPTVAVGSPDAGGGEVRLVGWSDGALRLGPVLGDAPGASAGARLAAEDLDGDGFLDLLVTAPGPDGGWRVPGPIAADAALPSAAAAHLSPPPDAAAVALLAVRDHDDDGIDDVLLSFTGSSDAVGFIVSGSHTGNLYIPDALATLVGARTFSGALAAPLGDTDGDGLDDVALADDVGTETLLAQGIVHIVTERLGGPTPLAETGGRVLGGQTRGGIGMLPFGPGDLDGDGYADLLVGAPAHDDGATDAGAAWLLSGPFADAREVSAAQATLLGVATDEAIGCAFAVGDIDEDGRPDLIVGGAESADARGEAVLLRAPFAGTTPSSDAPARWLGATSGDRVAAALLGAGDLDGDGAADLLLGAPGRSAVYLGRGGPGP